MQPMTATQITDFFFRRPADNRSLRAAMDDLTTAGFSNGHAMSLALGLRSVLMETLKGDIIAQHPKDAATILKDQIKWSPERFLGCEIRSLTYKPSIGITDQAYKAFTVMLETVAAQAPAILIPGSDVAPRQAPEESPKAADSAAPAAGISAPKP